VVVEAARVSDVLHVHPALDIILHKETDDCPCRPTMQTFEQ
jgi:hypothetical protein